SSIMRDAMRCAGRSGVRAKTTKPRVCERLRIIPLSPLHRHTTMRPTRTVRTLEHPKYPPVAMYRENTQASEPIVLINPRGQATSAGPLALPQRVPAENRRVFGSSFGVRVFTDHRLVLGGSPMGRHRQVQSTS